MFCKWCGGTLTPSDVKCSRCGKAVPPLSDCGGFYDLMPTAESRKEAAPVPKMETKKATVPVQKEAQSPKSVKKNPNHGYIYITLLGFAVIIVLVIVLFSRINQYSRVVDELKAELNSVSEELSNKENVTSTTENASLENDQVDTTPSKTTESENTEQTITSSTIEDTGNSPIESMTTESVPTETLGKDIQTILKKSPIEFEIKLAEKKDGTHEIRRLEPDELKGVLVATCNYDKVTEKYICNFNAHQDQVQNEKAFDFDIERKLNNDKYQISIKFEYQSGVLGDYDPLNPTDYTWQYRESDIGEWKDLPAEYCETTGSNSKVAQIVLDVEGLLNKEHPGKTEIMIRCTALRNNISGGSLTFTIYGLTVSLDDLENN